MTLAIWLLVIIMNPDANSYLQTDVVRVPLETKEDCIQIMQDIQVKRNYSFDTEEISISCEPIKQED